MQKIKPRITIVEEAAEVFESHIVTSLSNGCQHLILIGDHEQLKPNPTVYELAKYFSLDVSLFERMVRNGMPFARLRLQHRMRPEIACMVNHIYQDLENHESVMNFDNIRGISHNMFFVDHEEFEVLFFNSSSLYCLATSFVSRSIVLRSLIRSFSYILFYVIFLSHSKKLLCSSSGLGPPH